MTPATENKAIIEKIASATAWDKYKSADLLFPADAVLHAFEEGKKIEFETLLDKLLENTNKIAQDVSDLNSEFLTIKFEVTRVSLRINSISSFDVLVGVREEQYLSDEFSKAYHLANKIEEKRKDEYSLHFTFAPDSGGGLDEDELISEQFILSHKNFKA